MFLETPTFLLYSLHFLTAFSCPLQLLGLYCILFKTPKSMSSVKWILFNFHFWCLVFDLVLCVFNVPIILFPALAGVPLGIFTTFFGIPTVLQVYIIFTLLFMVFDANVLMFENRFYQLFAKNTLWRYIRIPVILLNYFFTITFMVPICLNTPEQSYAIRTVFQLIPNLPDDIASLPIYVLATDYRLFLAVFIFQTVFLLLEFIPLVLITHWNIFKSIKESTHSELTMKLQEKFLHAVYAQTGAFFIACFIPYVYILTSCLSGYYNQAANNFIFIFLALHGVICTLILLRAHKPYRDACLDIFQLGWWRKVSSARQIRTTVSVLL